MARRREAGSDLDSDSGLEVDPIGGWEGEGGERKGNSR